MNGFINIDKDENISSAAVVGQIKRLFNVKCGHMGTLDPLATGVLPIALGNATRLFDYILQKEKTYITDITFGNSTDTLDKLGAVTATTNYIPTAEEIVLASKNLLGEIMQVPPNFSAKHINGKRGYELARRGIDFTLEPKQVTVYSMDLITQKNKDTFTFKIVCSGGTYIRSIARDLAKLSGSLAHMSALRRTKSGVFDIKSAVTLTDLVNSQNRLEHIIKTDQVVDFLKIHLDKTQEQMALNGVKFKLFESDGIYRVYASEFLGIGEIKSGYFKMRTHTR